MVCKEGAGRTSEYKIEKNGTIYGRTGATHQGSHTKCSPNQAPMPQASKQLLNACVAQPM